MITAADISLLVASGEGYNAEFKVAVPARVKDLSEEVCAFANAAGGVVLIGVNDQNEIKGVNIDNAKRSAIQNSLGEITPALNCQLQLVEVAGKTVGVIEVPSGPNKPYVLSGAIYVRIGPNSQKLTTTEEMRDFFQQANRIYFDEAPCPDFNAGQIDDSFLPIFKAEANISSGVPNEQIFENLRLYAANGQFKNGAVLFFGREPEQIIDKAMVRCIAFDGADKRFIKDDKSFGGNLHLQYQKSMAWLRERINIAYDIEGQGSGPRKEVWEIPETALKEALVNALAHRDYYDRGALIHIELFSDRVEISNPGGLVSAIPDKEFGKRSHSRNPLIFGLFARMHLVEQVGSGIGRIKQLMAEAGLPEPQFQTSGMFTVVLPRVSETDKNPKNYPTSKPESRVKSRVKSRVRIMELIASQPNITMPEMAAKTKLTLKAIEKQISLLKEEGRLRREGPTHGGHWVVVTPEQPANNKPTKQH